MVVLRADSIGAVHLVVAEVARPGQVQAPKEEPRAAWTGYRGARRDGISPDANWTPWTGDRPNTLWTARIGSGYSAVVVFKGRAYTMGNTDDKDIVYCLDAETGEVLWTSSYNCPGVRKGFHGPRGTPSVDDQYVFTVSWQGEMNCFDVKTGEKIWTRTMEEFDCEHPNWGCACSPLIAGDRVIYDIGKIVALDKATGKTIWESDYFGIEGYSSPLLFNWQGKTCVLAYPKAGLVMVDAADGRVMSTFTWQCSVNATMPLVIGENIFVSSGYSKGGVLLKPKIDQFETLWKNKGMANTVNSSVYHEGNLYGFDGQVSSNNNRLRCLNVETNEIKWTQDGLGTGALTLAGDKLIIMGEGGQLAIAKADPAAYRQLAFTQVFDGRGWTMPTFENGRIYCRSESGKVICLDVRKPYP
jgi:outer membrane protein assembly factor BamB